jgi:hypothetical protein
MFFLALAVAASATLLGCAALLWKWSEDRPPVEIRSESGRSAEEHAFRRRINRYRDGSVACLIAGVAMAALGAGWLVTGYRGL